MAKDCTIQISDDTFQNAAGDKLYIACVLLSSCLLRYIIMKQNKYLIILFLLKLNKLHMKTIKWLCLQNIWMFHFCDKMKRIIEQRPWTSLLGSLTGG